MGGKSGKMPAPASPSPQVIYLPPQSPNVSATPTPVDVGEEPQQNIAPADKDGTSAVEPAAPRELTSEEISAISGAESQRQTSGNLNFPSYSGLTKQMTPLQARTRIATLGAAGDFGADPELFDIYRSYAFSSLAGNEQIPLPIEKEYISRVFGEKPAEGTGGFLSAIERIYGRGRK